MGEHLVKVLGLIRAMCGTGITLLSIGTREYIYNINDEQGLLCDISIS